MSDYRVLLVDASTGLPLAELPVAIDSFTRVLSGAGTFSGSISVDHPAVTEGNFYGDREITVIRNDQPVWNGPITNLDPTRASGVMGITAREPTWYFEKRTIEQDMTWTDTDVLDIARDLLDYMVTKTASGDDGMTAGDDILAAIPRWSVDTLMSGNIITLAPPNGGYAAQPRYTFLQALELLASDPETGFDYRVDYDTGSTRQVCHRTLMFSVPGVGGFGVTGPLLTERLAADYGRPLDWEQSATRVHGVGSGVTVTLQSAAAVSDGTLLLESVADVSETSNEAQVTERVREERRLRKPPVRTFSVSFVPGMALRFDAYNLGDTVPLATSAPSILSVAATRRVVQIETVPQNGRELVNVTFNVPLDELVA